MKKNKIVGFTAGNFDLIHPGYIYTFQEAKRHCDHFIVFLQRDPSLHRKSKYKPVELAPPVEEWQCPQFISK